MEFIQRNFLFTDDDEKIKDTFNNTHLEMFCISSTCIILPILFQATNKF